MKAAIGQQGLDAKLKLWRDALVFAPGAFDFPANEQPGLAIFHDDFADNAHIAHAIGELRPGIQRHILKILMPLGIESVGMLARRDKKFLAASGHGFFHGRKQHLASAGRCRNQKPVVFSGVAIKNAAGGIIP